MSFQLNHAKPSHGVRRVIVKVVVVVVVGTSLIVSSFRDGGGDAVMQ